jgi:hypothetical protein
MLTLYVSVVVAAAVCSFIGCVPAMVGLGIIAGVLIFRYEMRDIHMRAKHARAAKISARRAAAPR